MNDITLKFNCLDREHYAELNISSFSSHLLYTAFFIEPVMLKCKSAMNPSRQSNLEKARRFPNLDACEGRRVTTASMLSPPPSPARAGCLVRPKVLPDYPNTPENALGNFFRKKTYSCWRLRKIRS